jgi:CspA family cold shock protein
MREKGIIKAYVTDRGFGFIGRAGCADIFFHVSEFEPDDIKLIQKGTPVEFTVTTGRDGRPQAANVTLCEGGN